jgi:hypothetical protein
VFNEMEPSAIAAILAALVHDENSSSEKVLIKN